MMEIKKHVSIVIVVIGVLAGSLCGGCGDMKWHPIYTAALGGALVGAIVGHQYHEAGYGALIGAGIGATGELLHQSDITAKKQECKYSDKEEEITVKITNNNGSITSVKLKKKGDVYTGPKGEQYKELPTEEQLKPLYGL